MMKVSLRTACTASALTVLLLVGGCHRHRKSKSQPNTTAYADKLHEMVEKKVLPPEKVDTTKVPNLRWPNFSDYQSIVATFYDDRNYEVAWTRDGAPTDSAKSFIQAFQGAASKGLIPEDYDAPRWADRVQALNSKSEDAISLFDVAMTVNVMRYISDLRIGRVNPSHFNFEIPVQDKKYDLAEFVSDNAVDATDVPKLIAGVEPNSEEYRQTEAALAHYMDLAKQQAQSNEDPLPTVAKAVSVGGTYPAASALVMRLRLEGDLPAPGDPVPPLPMTFDSTLSDAVKHYQHRHGLTEDGKLTAQTIKSLNVPMDLRVAQLQDSLERWRWLPEPYLHARLMVNLPEFVLRGFDPDHKLDFTMRVVVGKVMGQHETPVFTHMMKYLVFRPYWSVPVDIARKELVPHIESNRGYLASKNFEVTNNKGVIQTDYTAHQVAQGAVMVREKPGPKNSLGLVKFIFPNQYDIYLHSTPAISLFEQTRRDFSHGCIRVQKPADLAAWVLQGQGDWDLDKVNEAMNSGPDNKTVSLKTPLPIVIFYLTAIVEDDNEVHFFDDIYNYDTEMQKVFSKGPPYPVKPEPIVPKTKEGETV
ncbi:L,D-transpeptidase family protein [Tunturibacter empetritectus]|uniref:Murein L,D-transpeptidase YcbB/YkuD n=1 Tax=Tunturiibacter empetritectus TaxID=3069691 RepID=A0A7W8IK88_9BACT|nr:L,D-transpeptidase family protein [Edaphobacter lichenicola]MBB5318604.1 murein L,D-transpeptidase YcbB/YkuD [Edaphobacter lichenicola]